MLEGPLHFLNIVGGLSNVLSHILRVLDGETRPVSIINSIPASLLLLIVPCPNRNAYFFVVKQGAIELKKVNQVFAQVHLLLREPLVLALQVAHHHDSEQERADATGVGLIELS